MVSQYTFSFKMFYVKCCKNVSMWINIEQEYKR